MNTSKNESKPFWPKYRLSTLLLVSALVAVTLAWWRERSEVRRLHQQLDKPALYAWLLLEYYIRDHMQEDRFSRTSREFYDRLARDTSIATGIPVDQPLPIPAGHSLNVKENGFTEDGDVDLSWKPRIR